MEKAVMLLVCSLYVLPVQCEVTLEADLPSLKVKLYSKAVLKCCFSAKEETGFAWVKLPNKILNLQSITNANSSQENLGNGKYCGVLTFSNTTLNDVGFYQCRFNASDQWTHGTYLQVNKPLEKTIKLSESTKNAILTTEGILLLLCVILPSATLLFKSKNLNELEKRKVKKEEENIYQGLDLDDCCAAYDQIERLQGQGPYEDVGNSEDDIQLEKP